VAPANRRLLDLLPAYWFLGLFQQLNGTMRAAFASLAEQAWIALAIALLSAVTILLLSWVVKLRRTVEEPDIVPGRRENRRPLSFGAPASTALVQFSLRSLLRSRQHRLFYAFYLSIGLAIALLYTGVFTTRANAHADSGTISAPFLVASLMVLCFAVLGLRIIIAIPVVLRANWIFQLTQMDAPSTYIRAARRALLVVAVVPIWLVMAILVLSYWPSWRSVVHLIALGFVGATLTDLAILRLRKHPFACSYIPGKGKLHFLFWGGILVGLPLINGAGTLEYRLLATRLGCIELLILVLSCAILLRWLNSRSRQDARSIIFQEEEPIDLLALKLNS